MKVLYISGATGADFLCDMVFHGLRSLLGPDCVDVQKLTFMYDNEPHPPFYTVYGLLPDIEIDRYDVQNKILRHEYDYIVYGSVHRCSLYLPYVLDAYPPAQIAFIDGEDDHGFIDIRKHGHYFKREFDEMHPSDVHPIQFCVPKQKILPIDVTAKKRLVSALIPGDYSTYVYYNHFDGDTGEQRYYAQYAESLFAKTKRKGGWDCCRHYEIMAAGALPIFDNLSACPARTLHWLPKLNLLAAQTLFNNWENTSEDQARWEELSLAVRTNLTAHLTTEAMAKYVLETLAK